MAIHRRQFLTGLGATAAGLSIGLSRAQGQTRAPRFLIVLGGTGGASIIDGPLAIRASESNNAAAINTFPDNQVTLFPNSPFRAIDMHRDELGPIPIGFNANQSNFVRKYTSQMVVATGTGTSVNHAIAQRRSVTGNEAWGGRSLQEIAALTYGEGYPIPNVHLATTTAYTERGTDASLPSWVYGEQVADPGLWPLSLDGKKGITNLSPELVEKARILRNDTLDPQSRFNRVFGENSRLRRWTEQRGTPQQRIEAADLISKLMLYPDSERFPLSRYGLSPSSASQRVREVFPKYDRDPLEAQAALAFLLLKFRVAVTVTLAPSFNVTIDETGGNLADDSMLNPPIGFDFSHQNHRGTQALMWNRLYKIADGLITLLQEEEFENGESMWDRSLLYMPTEFGRTKGRPANSVDFGSSHDLNNGTLIVSPMIQGNRVLGGVDPHTGLTYGYNPLTGEADPTRNMAEAYLFSGILDALQIETTGSGLPSVPVIRRAV